MAKEVDKSPNPRDPAQVYDAAADDFRKKAPELLTYTHIVRPAIQAALGAHFPPAERGDKQVLDIGSASGRNVRTLAAEGFAAGNIHGVEISPEQVAIARKEIPDATFEVGDISTHKLPKNSFDLAIMIMVAEFLDPQKYLQALNNIFSALKRSGLLVYITTHPDRYQAKYLVTKGEVTTKGPWGDGQFVNYVRPPKEQTAALRDAGFAVESTADLDIPPAVVADHPEFTHPSRHVRLSITARKP